MKKWVQNPFLNLSYNIVMIGAIAACNRSLNRICVWNFAGSNCLVFKNAMSLAKTSMGHLAFSQVAQNVTVFQNIIIALKEHQQSVSSSSGLPSKSMEISVFYSCSLHG